MPYGSDIDTEEGRAIAESLGVTKLPYISVRIAMGELAAHTVYETVIDLRTRVCYIGQHSDIGGEIRARAEAGSAGLPGAARPAEKRSARCS